MTSRGQRNLAAASATLLGLAIWAVYLAFWKLPVISYTPPLELKPFLVTYPVMASLGLLYWALARGAIQRALLRYVLGGFNALVTVYLGMEAFERLPAAGWPLDAAALSALLVTCCAITTWALWSGPGPGRWQATWLLAVAGVQTAAAPALFLIMQIMAGFAAGDVLAVLALALLPFALILLGYIVARGQVFWCAALAVVYGLITVYHLLAAVRIWQDLGAEGATGYTGLVGALAVALAAGLLAAVNTTVLRRGAEPKAPEED